MTYEIYGKSSCPYCVEATKLLDLRDIDYVYTDITFLTEHDKEKLQETAGIRFRTVPQIFKRVDDMLVYVGGYTSLKEDLS